MPRLGGPAPDFIGGRIQPDLVEDAGRHFDFRDAIEREIDRRTARRTVMTAARRRALPRDGVARNVHCIALENRVHAERRAVDAAACHAVAEIHVLRLGEDTHANCAAGAVAFVDGIAVHVSLPVFGGLSRSTYDVSAILHALAVGATVADHRRRKPGR
ncbi:hypothetical protein BURKHO8Y_30315 [Burkholderia sp. 8Y]|nr:hypothetical protein BURKHO8Y_30315 [Burkholderia sp. 8Y]